MALANLLTLRDSWSCHGQVPTEQSLPPPGKELSAQLDRWQTNLPVFFPNLLSVLPVSPQQLERSQDHDEVEWLHVKCQRHKPQERKQGH